MLICIESHLTSMLLVGLHWEQLKWMGSYLCRRAVLSRTNKWGLSKVWLVFFYTSEKVSCELVQLFGLWEPFIVGREWWGFCFFQGSKVQTRVGLLMLLCTWLSNCSIAVTHFLHNPANVPFVSLTCLQVNITCLEVSWIIPVKIKCLSQSVCRDTCRYKSRHTGAGNKRKLQNKGLCMHCAYGISPVSLTRAAADRTDCWEPGRGGTAGSGPLRTVAWHLHLLQRQLSGKLQEVSVMWE